MSPFPTPNVTETSDFFEVFKFVNNRATEGLFFPIILLVIWIVAFIGAIAEGRPASRAWIFASFISTVLGMLAALMGFLDAAYVYFLILNIAFAAAWIYLSKSRLD